MTEEEKIKEEIAFTDYWFTELGKTSTPTFADAIEWEQNRQRKIDAGKALKVYEELMTCSGYFPETITAELARMRNKLEE